MKQAFGHSNCLCIENTTGQPPVSLVQVMGLFDTKGVIVHTGTLQRPLCTHQPGYTHLDAVQRYKVWSHTTLKLKTLLCDRHGQGPLHLGCR